MIVIDAIVTDICVWNSWMRTVYCQNGHTTYLNYTNYTTIQI